LQTAGHQRASGLSQLYPGAEGAKAIPLTVPLPVFPLPENGTAARHIISPTLSHTRPAIPARIDNCNNLILFVYLNFLDWSTAISPVIFFRNSSYFYLTQPPFSG
jgi:hypothetical protein